LCCAPADPLVSLYSSLLAPEIAKWTPQPRVQQAINSACTLLQTTKKSASYAPLLSASAPTLLSSLCLTFKAHSTFTVSPSFLTTLISFILFNKATQLVRPTTQLLIQLSTPPPSELQQSAVWRAPKQAGTAAKQLLDKWNSAGIPDDDMDLLLLLPGLSKAAGAPQMHPSLQEQLESNLFDKSQMMVSEDVFKMVS